MSTDSVPLILPAEVKSRELHAKTLLACVAAEAGMPTVVGEQTEMMRVVAQLPRGIVIDKGMSARHLGNFKRFLALGFEVMAWCEEGISIFEPAIYARDRVSVEAAGMTARLLSWGEHHADAIALADPALRARLRPTGNPRFDLLRAPFRDAFDREVAALRAAHGDFILFNTNFAMFNFPGGHDYLAFMEGNGHRYTPEHRAFVREWVDYARRMFHRFVEMARHLAQVYPERIIVIRPHPSEDLDRWRREMAGLANVRIIREGTVAPWILASKVLVHNSCTTGIEALMLGRPVISYCPETSEAYDPRLPKVVSLRAADLGALTTLIDRALADDPTLMAPVVGNAETMAVVRRHVASFDGPFAAERVVAAVREAVSAGGLRIGTDARPDWWRALANHAATARFRARLAGGSLLGRGERLSSYVHAKFPPTPLAEIQGIVDDFRRVSARFAGVRVRRLPGTRHQFLFSRDG